MPDMVRIGFIGVGGIAGHHLRQLAAIEQAQIAALCDIDESRAKAASEQHGGAVYSDHHQMLDEVELDAVYVCIPPKFHTDQETLAAAKGCALFVEKPVALTMDKALEVQEAIGKAGVLSSVGYSVRYTAAYNVARDWLQGKQPSLLVVNRWGGIAGGETHWWRVMDISGGQLVEQATHQVDIVRYLLGEFKSVWARYEYASMAHHPNMTIPASQALSFELACGAVGTLTCTCATYQGGGGGGFDVILDGQRLEIGRQGVRVLPAAEGTDGTLPVPEQSMNIDQGFVAAVAGSDGSTIRSSYADAVRSLEVTLAANESAATGKVVECKAWR